MLWSTPVTLRAHGTKDLVLLDIRRWAGELFCEGVGAFLHFKMAFQISSPCRFDGFCENGFHDLDC